MISAVPFLAPCKNLQFLPNPHELIIFAKFHKEWSKIVDFLQGAKKGTAEITRGTGFS